MNVESELPCATCGYDLRMQPREGICPECATPVQKAVELAAIPLRPTWRDSDPRWRRRMVAGAWVLVLVPLVAALDWFDLAARLRVPGPYTPKLAIAETYAAWIWVYVVFCVGVVLFFAKERGRRPHPLDWTRRWGVFFSYIVLVLGVAYFGPVSALVAIGISASHMTLPIQNQPPWTELLIQLGTGYIHYGPDAGNALLMVLPVFSGGVVLLACVPLLEALRRSGSATWGLALLAPLALICLLHFARAIAYWLAPALVRSTPPPPFFFDPSTLMSAFSDLAAGTGGGIWVSFTRTSETAKWLVFGVTAVWLSLAQVRAWGKKPAP